MDRPLGTARRYAEAILDLAADAAGAEVQVAELERAAEVVRAPGARLILDDPRAATADRVAALERAAGGEFGTHTRSLLTMLAARRRLADVPAIAEAAREEIDERAGVTQARVSAATELGAAERSGLEAQAAKIAGGQVRMSYDIDTSLVGGVTLRVGDRMIDGSVKGRLARMRERILSAAG